MFSLTLYLFYLDSEFVGIKVSNGFGKSFSAYQLLICPDGISNILRRTNL